MLETLPFIDVVLLIVSATVAAVFGIVAFQYCSHRRLQKRLWQNRGYLTRGSERFGVAHG